VLLTLGISKLEHHFLVIDLRLDHIMIQYNWHIVRREFLPRVCPEEAGLADCIIADYKQARVLEANSGNRLFETLAALKKTVPKIETFRHTHRWDVIPPDRVDDRWTVKKSAEID
jgi:hypothetical protein